METENKKGPQEIIFEIISDVMEFPKEKLTTELSLSADLKMDYLDVMTIASEMSKAFYILLPEKIEKLDTVNDLIELVKNNAKPI